MEYKRAIEIVSRAMEKHSFSQEEKEAIMAAIGVLDSASIGDKMFKARISAQKANRKKDTEW